MYASGWSITKKEGDLRGGGTQLQPSQKQGGKGIRNLNRKETGINKIKITKAGGAIPDNRSPVLWRISSGEEGHVDGVLADPPVGSQKTR